MKNVWAILGLLVFVSSVAAQATKTVISPANAETLHEVVQARQGLIDTMALAPDESQLAIASVGRVYLYDLKTSDAPPAILDMGSEEITALEYAPIASLLVVGTKSGKVYFWNLPEKTINGMIEAQTSAITDMLFLKDPSRLVVGSKDGPASVWSIAMLTRTNVLEESQDGVVAMTLIDGGKQLVTAGIDIVNFWDSATMMLRTNIPGATSITAIATDPVLPMSLAIQSSNVLILDNDMDSKVGGVALTLDKGPQKLAFSPNGQWFADAIDDTVELRNPETGDVLHRMYHGGYLNSLAFSPDGSRLYSASGGSVIIWDTATGDVQRVISAEFGLSDSMSFNPEGTLLAAGNYINGTINIYDATTLKLIQVLDHAHQGTSIIGDSVNAVTFSPDGKYLASAGKADNNSIILWDVATGKPVRTLRGYKTTVSSLSFSPDGTVLLSTGAGYVSDSTDNMARLWDVATGKMLHEWEPHGGEDVYAGLFLPDGINVMTAGNDNFTRLWDAKSTKMIGEQATDFTPFGLAISAQEDRFVYSKLTSASYNSFTPADKFTPPTGYVSATSANAVFNPSGDLLAAVTDESEFIVFDLAAQKIAITINPPMGTVHTLVFSPDGTHLASASQDGILRLWGVEDK